MKKIVFIFACLILVVACTKKSEQTDAGPINEAQRKADSLQVATDSLAKIKQLHQSFSGTHQHAKNLAKHAHQDIPKKRRVLRKMREQLDSRKASYLREAERRKERIKAHQKQREEAAKDTLESIW